MTNAETLSGHPAPRPVQHDSNSHANSTRSLSRRYRRILRVVRVGGTILLTLVTFAGMLVAGALVTNHGLHQTVPTGQGHGIRNSSAHAETASAGAAVSHGRPLVVAFVAGTTGTVISDLLAPYDIFASSPAFRPYVVAAHAGPVPLEGGPALVPTHTFADVDADPALRPDLVVVPALSKPTDTAEAPLRTWVTGQHDRGAKILGVCAGSVVLAETGMLDGLQATSHWSRISALQHTRPAVQWLTGRRWVDDGSVTTTAAVSSGVPAALHLVAELAGPAEAQRIADLHPELGWNPNLTTVITKDHFAASDWPVGLNFVEPWFRPTVGIALNDGVGELDATAAFEVYAQSAAARTVALAAGDTVRTRHGLVLLTTSPRKAPSLSRITVPGADDIDPRLQQLAEGRHLDVEPLRVAIPGNGADRHSGGGFTAALQNLTDHSDAITASSTAKMIGYPTTDLDLHGGPTIPRTVLLALASLMLAALVWLTPAWISRKRRVAVDRFPATSAAPA